MKERAKQDLPSPSAGFGLDRLEIYSLTARGVLLGVMVVLALSIIAGLLS
jgi:hypothetical protein